jgi:type IV secretory pathway TraG/TraD family ATPase VirD4
MNGMIMTSRGRRVRRSVLPRAALSGLGLTGLGYVMALMPEGTPGRGYWPWLMLTGVGVLAAVIAVWRHRRGGSAGLVTRWAARGQRQHGLASPWAILRVSSGWAMRRKATLLRPGLRGLGWRRWLVSARAVATPVARVGWLRVWSPVEDVTLRIGGPRTGKTGELCCRILDAPGAVIATSTRTDLIELTAACRERIGPVHLFNPSGVGGIASTITFDPLSGCTDPRTATSRAMDLLAAGAAPGGSGGDREYWTNQARRVLAALLHAASLGHATMRDVLAWVADPDSAAAEIHQFLRRSPQPAYESDATQFLDTNERTRSSICATIMPALGWLTDTTAAAAAQAGDFDVAELLESRGTVYMLGADDGQVAPLVTALTGHIAREARRIAATDSHLAARGRLDPPLTLALDEAALICPIPLDNWTADMGGRNVTIHIGAQSRAQLRQRWGDTGAAAILNNTATLLIYGGTRDPDDLAAYSTLTGERYEDTPTWDQTGELSSMSRHRVPVLSPAQIAQLPARHVVIIRRGMAPAVGTVQMAWTRPEVKAARRAQAWGERTLRWAQAWEQLSQFAAGWAAATEFRGVPLATRLGLTLHHPLPGEATDSEGNQA